MSRPSRRTATWSERESASDWSWVTSSPVALRGPEGPAPRRVRSTRAATRRARRTARRGARRWDPGPGRGRGRRAAAGPRTARAGRRPRKARGSSTRSSISSIRAPVARSPRGQAEADVAGHVEVREERALLRDVAHPAILRAASAGCRRRPRRVVEGDGARRRAGQEPGDQPQQGRLAAAARPEHGRERAVRHVQADVVDRVGRLRPEPSTGWTCSPPHRQCAHGCSLS